MNYEKKLPIIFGKFKISEFLDLKKNLQKKNIDEKNISKYYFHKNKRWDLHYSNNIIIKLPRENLDSAFQILNEFKNNYKIKPNSIVDLRISNRIILQNNLLFARGSSSFTPPKGHGGIWGKGGVSRAQGYTG